MPQPLVARKTVARLPTSCSTGTQGGDEPAWLSTGPPGSGGDFMALKLTPFIAALTCVSLVACEPAPQPPPPAAYAPPPRALTVTAQHGQNKAQQDRDSAACQSMASGQATSSETWAQIFTACMGGRGYMVQ